MKKRLRIGEVAEMLGIPADTLRYFDKHDIVSPHKDAGNNYRYYDDWEINFLIEYKKYRSFQFNVNETKDILYEDSLADLISKFEHKAAELDEQIRMLEMVNGRVKAYAQSLKSIEGRVGGYSAVELDDIYYYKIRYNNDYLYEEDNIKGSHTWLDNFPVTEPALIIEDVGSGSYSCGFAVSKSDAGRVGLDMNPHVKKASAGTYINTVIVAGERHTFSTGLLQPALDYIDANGYALNGTIIGYYLARVHEQQSYRRYIEINLPIQRKNY